MALCLDEDHDPASKPAESLIMPVGGTVYLSNHNRPSLGSGCLRPEPPGLPQVGQVLAQPLGQLDQGGVGRCRLRPRGAGLVLEDAPGWRLLAQLEAPRPRRVLPIGADFEGAAAVGGDDGAPGARVVRREWQALGLVLS